MCKSWVRSRVSRWTDVKSYIHRRQFASRALRSNRTLTSPKLTAASTSRSSLCPSSPAIERHDRTSDDSDRSVPPRGIALEAEHRCEHRQTAETADGRLGGMSFATADSVELPPRRRSSAVLANRAILQNVRVIMGFQVGFFGKWLMCDRCRCKGLTVEVTATTHQ